MKDLLRDWFTNRYLMTSLIAGIVIGLFAPLPLLTVALWVLGVATVGTIAKAIHLIFMSPPPTEDDGDDNGYEFLPYAIILAATVPCLVGIGIVKLIGCFL